MEKLVENDQKFAINLGDILQMKEKLVLQIKKQSEAMRMDEKTTCIY